GPTGRGASRRTGLLPTPGHSRPGPATGGWADGRQPAAGAGCGPLGLKGASVSLLLTAGPGGRVGGQVARQLQAWIADLPLPDQAQLGGGQLKVAHGNAHVNTLEIGYPYQPTNSSRRVSGGAMQV